MTYVDSGIIYCLSHLQISRTCTYQWGQDLGEMVREVWSAIKLALGVTWMFCFRLTTVAWEEPGTCIVLNVVCPSDAGFGPSNPTIVGSGLFGILQSNSRSGISPRSLLFLRGGFTLGLNRAVPWACCFGFASHLDLYSQFVQFRVLRSLYLRTCYRITVGLSRQC